MLTTSHSRQAQGVEARLACLTPSSSCRTKPAPQRTGEGPIADSERKWGAFSCTGQTDGALQKCNSETSYCQFCICVH